MRRIRRVAVALAASAVFLGVMGAGSAQALTIKPCTGSGSLTTGASGIPGFPVLWTIRGAGNCPANLRLLLNPLEPQTVQFAGQGVSSSLGLCDGSLLVQNLFIPVRVRYENTVNHAVTLETQYWRAPITLFPLATPFLMTHNPGHGAFGVGIIIHHILLNCGNAGAMPSATFLWAETRNP